MWFIYIIHSEKLDKYYNGITEDLEWRLERHNQGWGSFTKGGTPWKLVYSEQYPTKHRALMREGEIRSKKSRKFIESLLKNNLFSPGSSQHIRLKGSHSYVPIWSIRQTLLLISFI